MNAGPTPKITRLSKGLVAFLVVLFALQYFVPSCLEYLALVPGRTLPCVWNLVTAGFISTNPYKLVVECAALLFLARLIEPAYGSKEFLSFILIVDFFTSLTVFVGVYLTFLAYQTEGILYMKFTGFHGILFGLLVALKQITPDQEVKTLSFINLKVKHMPSIVLLVAVLVCTALRMYAQLPFMIVGSYVAWLYLRFFQKQAESQYSGDPSDDFKFSSFFPWFMAPVIDTIAALFSLVFRLKHSSTDVKTMSMPAVPSALGADAADANRRRERGAKALEERLGMKKQAVSDMEAGASPEIGSSP